jgi:hypothetical protein
MALSIACYGGAGLGRSGAATLDKAALDRPEAGRLRNQTG